MAFFEFLSSIGDLLNSTVGKFIKPIGGQGTNDIFPNPKGGLPQNPGSSNAGAVVLDADGSLRTRASVVSTRQNVRDDFTGASLSTALTGTLTFTAGSVTVVGTGTTFTTQVTRDLYVKLNTDTETAWTKVRRVVSDTALELEQGYLGTTGGPAAASSTKWPTTTGAGGSFTVGSSLVNILSGVTNGSQSFIYRKLDFAAIHIDFIALNISQVLAQQQGFAGVFDVVSAPTQQAAFIFDGSLPNTQVRCRSGFTATATDIQETVVTLPFGLTTNLLTVNYSIDITATDVVFTINGVAVAAHSLHTPEQFVVMSLGVGIKNTAVPGSSTTVSLNAAIIRSFDNIIEQTSVNEDVFHYITGALTTTATTADQVIISYTVPANKVAFIAGYIVSTAGNTDGVPVKIGKNTITPEPAAPGVQDGNLFRIFVVERNIESSREEDFSAMPRQFGFSGDVIKVTVTPSGTGATIWRATLDIVLRSA